jgi:N-acetylmuramoyl-L-alanine amidase/putative cell wall-binding protein
MSSLSLFKGKIAKIIIVAACLAFLTIEPAAALLVIDPGHGGSDSGATATYCGKLVLEKNLNFSVALKTNEFLKKFGFETTLTRTGDLKVELEERVTLANGLPADLYISIHHNSFFNSDVRGVEVYYYKTNANGKMLAEMLATSISKMTGLPNRGAKPTDKLYVIKNTKATAVLVECGFMSNRNDLAILVSSDGQQKIAAAIAEALANFVWEKFVSSGAFQRIIGKDRCETSLLLSKKYFTRAENVIMVNGFAPSDSLCAASLAGALSAPILFVFKDGPDLRTLNELVRLKAKKVYIVGGYGVVSADAEKILNSNGFATERIYGLDRYETASRVAKYLSQKSLIKGVFVVNGDCYSDAVSCGAIANKLVYPILFVKEKRLSYHTAVVLQELKARNPELEIIVVGGEASVSNELFQTIGADLRLAGEDRYATNLEVQKFGLEKGAISSEKVFLGSGCEPIDLLASSGLGSKLGQLVVLSKNEVLPKLTFLFLDEATTTRTVFTLLGGPKVLGSGVEKDLSIIWLNN